jgi:hypothetical protein
VVRKCNGWELTIERIIENNIQIFIIYSYEKELYYLKIIYMYMLYKIWWVYIYIFKEGKLIMIATFVFN